jgi:uncharacterized membrane protein YfcA
MPVQEVARAWASMLSSFTPETLVLAGIVAAIAAVIRGITGFGGAMVMAPPLALLLGPRVAVPVTLLLEGFAAMPMLTQTRSLVRWPLIGPILAAACVLIPLGSYVLVMADALTLRRAIAVAVIACALLMLSGQRYSGHRLSTSVGLGALSGAMTGAIGIGAPPVILYLLSGPDPVATTRANLTFYLVGISLAALVMFWMQDVLDQRCVLIALVLAPGYYCGLVVGLRLFSRFNDTRFRQFTLLLLITVSTGILLA